MAVIITNMDMPEDCYDCEINKCCRKSGLLNIQNREVDCPLKSTDELLKRINESIEQNNKWNYKGIVTGLVIALTIIKDYLRRIDHEKR